MARPTLPLRRRPAVVAFAALALAGVGPTVAAGAQESAAAARAEIVLVKVDPDASRAERAEVRTALGAKSVESLPAGWRAYSLPSPVTLADAREDLVDIEVDRAVELAKKVTISAAPNDPLFTTAGGGYQWGLSNTASWTNGVAGVDIGALAGWEQAAPSATPTIVAVLDTGVEVGHPDLAGRIATNPAEIASNGIDDDANGFVDDAIGWDFAADNDSVFDSTTDDRHGTHIAGIIAANRDNGIGVAGVASNARILPVKFIGAGGSGWNSDAISGLQYAVARGAKVVNASFGGTSYDAALCDAIAWAASQGTVVVAAAGNNGQNLDGYGVWPAKCSEPSLVTVAAITHTGAVAGFSNRSTTHVDIGAPGEFITSTLPGGYGFMSGTSMATPFVAGVAAAIIGEHGTFTPAQVRATLLNSGIPMATLATTTTSGRRLSLPGALTVASGGSIDVSAPSAPALTAPANGSALASRRPVFSWQPSLDNSGVAGYGLYIDGALVAGSLTGTSYIPQTDLAAGTHTWRVEARDALGNSTPSADASFVVDATSPTVPTLVLPAESAQVRAGAVRFTWIAASDPESGIDRYELVIDNTVAATTAGATQATVAVRPGTRTWTVRAIDRAGNVASAGTQVVKVTAAATGTAPKVRPIRVGRRTTLAIRVATASRLQITVTSASGKKLGSLIVSAPAGKSTFALPATLSRKLTAGAFTFRVRDTATLATSLSRLSARKN